RSHPDDKLIVVTREIIVQNELGLHARPAAEFVRVANSFRAEITLIKDEQRFSAASLIVVLPPCWKHAEPTPKRLSLAWKNCWLNFGTGKRIRTRPSVSALNI